MYPLTKPERMNYLNKALDKINTSTCRNELNRLKYAVNNPSFEWSADNKNILNDAIDNRLKEI
jgi:hypothetical protein